MWGFLLKRVTWDGEQNEIGMYEDDFYGSRE